MSDDNKEPIQEGHDQSDLDNLPAGERKETEEILGDIESGGKKPDAAADAGKGADDDVTDPEKPVVADETKKPDVEKPAKPVEAEKPKVEERRPATLVPAYVLKIQEDQSNKKIAELTAELEKASEAGKKALEAGVKPEDAQATLDKRLEAIAEKSGIKVEVLKEVIDLVKPGQVELPEDLKKDLQAAKDLRAERAVEVESAKYSSDFDRTILPLIQAEYGKDVPADTITTIKESLKAKAYNPDYAKVPYSTIYKGEDEFRNLVNLKNKGGEGSRGGTTALSEAANADKGNGVDWEALTKSDTQELSENEVRNLSDDDFDKYGQMMESREARIRSRKTAGGK